MCRNLRFDNEDRCVSRIRIIGVVSALVFWLLSVQGSALALRCDGDCTEIDFDSGVGLMADFDDAGSSARVDFACREPGNRDFAVDCTTRFDMAQVDIRNDPIPTLSRWWMIIAIVSLAFVGLFYLHLESFKNLDNVLSEDADEQRREMAKALADAVHDHFPGQ